MSSILGASCRGLSKSVLNTCDPCIANENYYLSPVDYPYPPLTNSNQYYLPPRANHPGDLMCDCNTVIYRCEVSILEGEPGIVFYPSI